MKSEHPPEIPVFRPDMSEEEIEAVAATLRSGWIGAGPRTAEFEARFAEFVGTRFAVSTNSGTAALQAALAALEVGAGDEVILPSFTWASGLQAILSTGATPVFADVEPNYLTLDAADVARAITPRTRGIVAIHHGGQLADIDALSRVAAERGLWLIDDAAHACGAALGARRVGSLCRLTCFSFNAMKNLTTGDGGMVTTDDAELARRARLFRSLGIDRDTFTRYSSDHSNARWVYDVVTEGLRLHMNDIAAAIGLVQLRRLDELNARRGVLVARYHEAFAGIEGFRAVGTRPGTRPSHHMFTLRVPERERFIDVMRSHGISVGVHYIPAHRFSLARAWQRVLPVTEQVWQDVVTLPVYPAMTPEEQDRVIAAARAAAGAGRTA